MIVFQSQLKSIKHFKNEPNTLQDILEQPLWLNKYIMINNKCIYWKAWTKVEISYINDIINKTLYHLMNYRKNTTLKPITLLHYKYTQVYQITGLKL